MTVVVDLDPHLPQLLELPLVTFPETNPLASPYSSPDRSGFINAGLGNFVWIDANGNGLQDNGNGPLDPGEVGLNGVSVRLLTLSGELVAETTTTHGPADAPGWYTFEDIDFPLPEPGAPLAPPSYIIEFEAPPGFSFTQQDADPAQYLSGESPIDSDVDPETGRLETLPLSPRELGAPMFTLDAGLIPNATPAIDETADPLLGQIGPKCLVGLPEEAPLVEEIGHGNPHRQEAYSSDRADSVMAINGDLGGDGALVLASDGAPHHPVKPDVMGGRLFEAGLGATAYSQGDGLVDPAQGDPFIGSGAIAIFLKVPEVEFLHANPAD